MHKTSKILGLLSVSLTANAYSLNGNGADALIKRSTAEIRKAAEKVKMVYSHESKVASGNSVAFTGQTFRQVLLADLTKFMKSLDVGAYAETEEDLLEVLTSYYEFDLNADPFAEDAINGDSEFEVLPKTKTPMEVTEGYIYADLTSSNKQPLNKLAGNDNALYHGRLLGWDSDLVSGIDLSSVDYDGKNDGFVEPEDLISAIFTAYAQRAVNGESFTVPNGSLASQRIDAARITKDGLDLAQLTEKFTQGALSFSQTARDYLSVDLSNSKGLNASDNKAAKDGKAYTALEHHWDEGFGYMGPAKDILAYSKRNLRDYTLKIQTKMAVFL